MIQKDFNEKAMEEKIKDNLKKMTLKEMKIALREELIANRKSALALDSRATELFDQIEYMDKKEGK